MGLILLDSTVIVGFLDADDALHAVTRARLAQIVVTEQPLGASVISYGEVMTGVVRGHHDREHVEGFFDALIRELLPVNRRVAAKAATLRGRNSSLKMPDALILATAETYDGTDVVLCADGAWPKLDGLSRRVELLRP